MANRKKFIEFNDTRVVSEFTEEKLYFDIKNTYPILESIKYVPKMFFSNRTITMPYCGKCLDELELHIEEKRKIKSQIIDFIKILYDKKIAHRDFHIKNICWDHRQIWVIDWEFVIAHSPGKITDHYDLTGTGLESPMRTDNMNVFSTSSKSVMNWLKPTDISINDFILSRQELIEKEIRKTTGYSNYNGWGNRRTSNGYHSFNIDEINITGQRNPRKRFEVLSKYVDFKDKVVIDFGCNVGGMLFHAPGIKSGIGFDFDKKCINAANNIKNILDHKTIHFHVFDFDRDDYEILKDKINTKPDIIFMLSIGAWVKNIEKLLQLSVDYNPIIILETNNDEIGKKELEFFNKKNLQPKLIIHNSEDDCTPENKNHRKTYLIDCTNG